MRSRLPLLTMALALVSALLLSCGDSKPANPQPDKGPARDTAQPYPDIPQYPDVAQPDRYVWPDHQVVDKPPPGEPYVGTPFGCQSNSDCFGQLCCPTPWGVKLCAPSCDIK